LGASDRGGNGIGGGRCIGRLGVTCQRAQAPTSILSPFSLPRVYDDPQRSSRYNQTPRSGVSACAFVGLALAARHRELAIGAGIRDHRERAGHGAINAG
jgi:hypothetical protein